MRRPAESRTSGGLVCGGLCGIMKNNFIGQFETILSLNKTTGPPFLFPFAHDVRREGRMFENGGKGGERLRRLSFLCAFFGARGGFLE